MTPPRHWLNAATAVLVIAAMLGLSGCNLQAGKTSTTTNGTGNQAAGHVGLSVSSLSFGSVAVGSSKTMHLTLTNSTATGGPNVTVSQVKASGTGFSTTSTSSVDLQPGQTTDIAILFKPTASGSASGNLTIDVVGATDPATVPLSGSGSSSSTPAAQLSVSPATLAFGSVNVGSSKDMTGTLQATNADVTISSAAWNGTGYSISGVTFPVTVKAGASKTFTVSFVPQAAGSANGNLSFTSNATNTPSNESFTGTGVAVAQHHTVSLSWVPSTSSVAGYNVYRANQSGGPYARLNGSLRTAANYSDSSVQSGKVYYYVATSVDSSSTESSYSGEAAAVVPSP
jgi:hypothetical protein